MWIPSISLLHSIAVQLADHAIAGPFSGVLDGTFLGLYIAPTPPLNKGSVIGDITEATFTGYARQALVWDTPYIAMDNQEVLEAASLHYVPSDAVTPNTITGLFIASASSAGTLLCSAPLPSPGVPLTGPTTALTVIARFGLDFSGNWGDYITVN